MISEEQIWNYMDGSLNEAEHQEVALAIDSNKEAAELFKEISLLHNSLKNEALVAPPALFTNRVMNAVSAAPAKVSIKPLIIFALACFCLAVACLVLVIYYQVPFTFNIPIPALPAIPHLNMYFIVADIILLAYFMESLSEYRFNRKALFS